MILDTLIHIPGDISLSYCEEPRKPFVEQALIDKQWNEFLKKKPKAFDATQLLTPEIEVDFDGQALKMPTYEGKYSWLMYILENPDTPKEKWWLTIVPKPILLTADGYMLFGYQAQHTTHGGKILAIGGGLDKKDIINGKPDIEACMTREMKEETGLINGEHYSGLRLLGAYLFSHNPSIILPFMAQSSLSKAQIQAHFEAHNASLVAKGEMPELESIVFVGNNETFPKDSIIYPYIPPAIEKIELII
jgi:8-oxo-dGTP pyrophosphatase MutT (NUDIX family)